MSRVDPAREMAAIRTEGQKKREVLVWDPARHWEDQEEGWTYWTLPTN